MKKKNKRWVKYDLFVYLYSDLSAHRDYEELDSEYLCRFEWC